MGKLTFVLSTLILSALARISGAQAATGAEARHFWLNIGGPAVADFGADRTDFLFGGPTQTQQFPSAPGRPPVFNSYRFGPGVSGFGYKFLVEEDGNYFCGLHFMEHEDVGPGERFFAVQINGVPVPSVDVAAEVGRFTPLVRSVSNIRAEGSISVELLPRVGDPFLAGVTCSRVGDVETVPETEMTDAPTTTVPPTEPPTEPPTTRPVDTTVAITEAPTTVPTGLTDAVVTTTPSVSAPVVSTSFPVGVTVPDEQVTARLDPPLLVEDDEVGQTVSFLLTMDRDAEVTENLKEAVKRAAAGEAGNDVDRWALTGIEPDPKSAPTEDERQYAFLTKTALPEGPDGEEKLDMLTSAVKDGDITQALLADDDASGFRGIEFVSEPKFATGSTSSRDESDDSSSDGNGDGSDSGSNVSAIIGGAVAGCVVLLALCAGVAVFAMRRSSNSVDQNVYDDPPPAFGEEDAVIDDVETPAADEFVGAGSGHPTMLAGVPDMDSRGIDAPTPGPDDYMDDPDSTFTAATSHAEEQIASRGVDEMDRDVWGRGTGSDY